MIDELDAIHENDHAVLKFLVNDTDGTERQIVNATVEATAYNPMSGVSVILGSDIADVETNTFTVDILPESLTPGKWRIMARLTLLNGESQVPLDRTIEVKREYT